MSMIFVLKKVNETEFEAILDNPDFVTEDDLISGKNTDSELWLDKYWDVMQHLFAEDAFDYDSVQGKVVMGGQPVDEAVDMGFGPVMYVSPVEIAQINKHLASLPADFVMNRLKQLQANTEADEIYMIEELAAFTDAELKEVETECNTLLQQLKDFYQSAAAENVKVIKLLS